MYTRGRKKRDEKLKEEQRAKAQRDFSWTLPEELTLNILSRLPAKSLMRCSCVCKSWQTLVSTPYLINLHLEQAKQAAENPDVLFVDFRDNPDEALQNRDIYIVENVGTHNETVKILPLPEHLKSCHLIDSCNGLICFYNLPNRDRLTYVYNPCTRECTQLPSSPYQRQSIIFGFGQSPTSGEYKVIAFISIALEPLDLGDHVITLAEVCTLGSDRWRSTEVVPFTPIDPPSYFVKDGVFHWLSYNFDITLVGIGSFDIAKEKFEFVPFPLEIFGSKDTHYLEMGVIEGCISVVDFISSESTEIWMSKNYRDRSWTRKYILSMPNMPNRTKLMRLLCTLKDGEILFFNNYNLLVSCDPSSGRFRDVGVRGVSEVLEAYVHVGTLISPVQDCGAKERQRDDGANAGLLERLLKIGFL